MEKTSMKKDNCGKKQITNIKNIIYDNICALHKTRKLYDAGKVSSIKVNDICRISENLVLQAKALAMYSHAEEVLAYKGGTPAQIEAHNKMSAEVNN